MNHKRRGLALIFNQERFFFRLGLGERKGTNADSCNLLERYPSPTPLLWFLEEHILTKSFEFFCSNYAPPEPIFAHHIDSRS